MTIEDVKGFYVTWANAMRKLGLSKFAYRYWMQVGYIPINIQIKIEQLTEGRLKACLRELAQNDKVTK